MSTDAYRKCAKCGATPIQDSTLSFHRFPKPGKTNILRARAWAKYCWPEQDWLSVGALMQLFTSNKVLCKRHFEDHCFTDSSKKNLGRFSVPGEKQYVNNLMETLRKEKTLMRQNDEQQSEPKPKSTTTKMDSSAETVPPQNVAPKPQQQSEPKPKSTTTKMDSSAETVPPQNVAPKPQQQSEPKPISTTTKMDSSAETVPPQNVASKSQQQHGHVLRFEEQPQMLISEESMPLETESTKHSVLHCEPGPSSQVHNVSIIKRKKKKGILKSLNVKKVMQLTPRERKLYFMCTQSLKEVNRLRKKLKSKSNLDSVTKICEAENVRGLVDMKMSNSFIILLQSQLRNCKRKEKGRRYSIDQKIMALTLYKKSPACYRLLRRMITLPCQSTLNKLLNSIPLKTGINNQIFEGLKQMAVYHLDEENLCIMSFDEMAIRKHLEYNKKLDLIEGYQDHGNHERTYQIASNALVFMLSGIRKKWKQPIAFYFSGKCVTSDRLSVIIKEILHECFKIGLNVVATVCDLSRVNLKALDILGSSKEQPYFEHEGHEVVTILDPPHLLKCTRNLFLKYNIECTTDVQIDEKVVKGVAKWSHIKTFYELDKKNPIFVYAPALTEHHLNPNSKQKMRVKLAAQVFSHSVSGGMLSKIAFNELPAEAHATATLLKKFDQLFDALNADSPDLRRGKTYSTNMSTRSPHKELFDSMRKFISDMKFLGSNSPPPSQVGWVRTMNAVERLWKNLLILNIKSLSTRRLNQDPLENCFGCIRYHCGSNDNPNIAQFISGIKTAIISNLRHSSTKKNCEDDNYILGDNLKSFLLSSCENEDTGEMLECNMDISLESLIADATEAIEQASPEAQACAYVCGFIFKKLKNNNCVNCKKVFLNESTIDPIYSFINFKEYNTMHNSLNYVKSSIVLCVETSALIIKNILDAEAWHKNIKSKIMSALSQVDFDFLNECPNHKSQNKNEIQLSTFYVCVKRYTVLKNREFGEEEKKKMLQRKLRILRNK